jgi:transcriptional regulator with XRE-family HTH domain
VTPKQSKAARAILGWSQTRLAKESGLGLSTVLDFEKDHRKVSSESIAAMKSALEAAGVEFTKGGVIGQ